MKNKIYKNTVTPTCCFTCGRVTSKFVTRVQRHLENLLCYDTFFTKV